MRRDLAQPLDAGVLHGDVRVEAPGDGAGDEGGAFLLKQLDQPLFPRHQRIDLRRLAVEEGDNGALFTGGWDWHAIAPQLDRREVINGVRISPGSENASLRHCVHEEVEESRYVARRPGPHTVNCLLVEALIKLTTPDCGPADLSTLTNENVSRPKQIAIAVGWRKVHLRETMDVHGVPLDIDVAQVLARRFTGDSLRIEHLAKRHFVARIHRSNIPGRRDLT